MGCRQEDAKIAYLKSFESPIASNTFYVVNLNSCADCVALNIDMLHQSKKDWTLIFIGEDFKKSSKMDWILNNYKVYFDKQNLYRKYKLYTEKPLMITLDEKYRIVEAKNIMDHQLNEL